MIEKEPYIAMVAKEPSKDSPSDNVTIEIEDNQDIEPHSDSNLPESKNQSSQKKKRVEHQHH